MGDEINGVIDGIRQDINDIVDQLAPLGVNLTLIFITLGIVFLGATYMSGSTAFVSPVLRFLGVNFGVLWALRNWTWLVGLSRQTAKDALRAVGIEGYGAMFELAWTSAQRIVNEMAGFTVTDPIASVGDSVIVAMCALVVLIGLSAGSIASAIVRGTPGVMGSHSVLNVISTTSSAALAARHAARGGGGGQGGGTGRGQGGAGGAPSGKSQGPSGGGSPGGMGQVGVHSTGSAFP